MSDAECERFVATAVPAYAADKVGSGQWAKDSRSNSRKKALLELLPPGRQTADNYLVSVLDDQARPLGTRWIAVKEQACKRIAYVYDIRVRPECQRQGHAAWALAAVEEEARKLGFASHRFEPRT